MINEYYFMVSRSLKLFLGFIRMIMVTCDVTRCPTQNNFISIKLTIATKLQLLNETIVVRNYPFVHSRKSRVHTKPMNRDYKLNTRVFEARNFSMFFLKIQF